MRTLVTLSFLVLLSTVIIACKDRAPAVASDPAGPSTEETVEDPAGNGTSSTEAPDPEETVAQTDPRHVPDSLVFRLERTACFGTCPAFRLNVYNSGFATYEGIAHVELIGMHHGRVDRSTVDQLVREAEQRGFFEMKDEYDSPVTDLPSTIIIVRRNGDTKKVKGRVDQPQAFKDLAARAEELLLPISWEPVTPQE